MSKQDIPEGVWPCVVIGAKFGEDSERPGIGRVQINVRISDGPAAGRMTTYEDEINAKSAPYIARSCKAVGWKGGSLRTLDDDSTDWIKTSGGKSTAEIKHFLKKKGKDYDAWVADGMKAPQPIWAKCNGIGRGAKPLDAASATSLADADDAMRRAMADDNTNYDDAPSSASPTANGDDLPF